MRLRLIIMLATAVTTLTSMSQCTSSVKFWDGNPFDPVYYCPIKANINGVDYASKEYMHLSDTDFWLIDFKVRSDVYYLYTGKLTIASPSGSKMYIMFTLDEEIGRSQLKLGEKYRPKIYLGDYVYGDLPSTTEGWITIESYKENLECKFECVLRDTLTNEIIYDVKDGYFSLPYSN